MDSAKSLLVLIGRILMSALFLMGAYWHVTNWSSALGKMTATGVKYPEILLIIATVILFLGGVSLLIGYFTRVSIVLLLIEVAGTAVLFHPFWTSTGGEMQLALLAFLTRMAICGGLLFLLFSGPGRFSINSK